MHPYIYRGLEAKLKALSEAFPVVVITGGRQVGKSTLLSHTFPHLSHIVFDPTIDIENARRDPDLFLNNRKPPLILDEIQYAPELVSAIKRRLEKDRRAGQYFLTGSQQWGVMKMLAESLAGRAVFLDLEGFSLLEIAKGKPRQSWLEHWLTKATLPSHSKKFPLPFTLYEQLWRGFLPEAQFLKKEFLPTFLESYQRTTIERDIRQMADISDLQLFGRFFKLCGALTAQEINFSQLGREIGITPQTARRWLDFLMATFQWFEIPAYSGNTIKRISLKPKGYLSDTGLVCATQAVSTPEAMGSHPLWGSIFETAVVTEVRKHSRWLNASPNIFHWRSHGGAEVDLLLERDGHFYPIEIKGKSHPGKEDITGIQAFRKTYPKLLHKPGLVIAPADQSYPLGNDIWVLPWNACF